MSPAPAYWQSVGAGGGLNENHALAPDEGASSSREESKCPVAPSRLKRSVGRTSGAVGQFVPQSRYLAERGMVAIVADYRVFARHATSPFEAIADAKSAIRWVRSHAKALHIDPSRIAAGGGSSGGHIALSAG